MTAPAKEFVLKHVFKDIQNFKEEEYQYSPTEEHFNIPWYMSIRRLDGHLRHHLFCDQPENVEWGVHVEYKANLKSVTGKRKSLSYSKKLDTKDSNWGFPEFISWEDLTKEYVIDGNITIESHIKIMKMTGIEKKKAEKFRFDNGNVFGYCDYCGR